MAIGNTPQDRPALSEEQRQHFLEHGWVRIPKAISPENIEKFSSDVWVRLGYDKDDMSTWKQEQIHLPRHREIQWKEFTPKAWSAICEILGGEDKIDPNLFSKCGDSLTVNLGTEGWREKTIHPRDLDNWHVDGDWFERYLDSGEQALVPLMLFNEVKPRAGATCICEDGLNHMIKWLHDRPQGSTTMTDPDGKRAIDVINECNKFVELTGEAGDVFLCHPLMPHSASKNHLRVPRFLTNSPVVLKEPLNFNRSNPQEYSLVELKTLRELGVESLPEWHITGVRSKFTPITRTGKDARIKEELERMKAHAAKTGGIVDSMHINGIVKYSPDIL
ncbi:hypothetical protein M422DRAFT_267717 [Sphaerobolus stellatus SS14]|uniref:Phytanoyl-CoA dioxygenase n=1 Tax=Sphaerobolus stellatus (strain SS14) TaxID=990650 RepID=A0A0C9UZ29_SPHS4|nr:hypothetical protein M422DRAFT_267717 [Sphaerobolus stellatus SS14]